MKTTMFLSSLFLFPLIGLAVIARSAWVKVLAFLAGLGMSSACNADGTKPKAEADDPNSMVECYKQVAFTSTIMSNPRRAHSDYIADWATAERAILAYANGGGANFDEMETKIAAAQQTAISAKPIVTTGLLSQPVYDLAVSILAEWHADMATSYSGVKCYKKKVTPPVVEDSTSRLMALGRLQSQGKLTSEALAQAKEGMKSSLTASLSVKQSAELADFLLDLLGFAQ